jgi:hypothetical protein
MVECVETRRVTQYDGDGSRQMRIFGNVAESRASPSLDVMFI